MIVSVHQPQYIPWLGYFHKIAKSDCFVFLDRVQYKPREFQNRNKIRIKKGWVWLTVPVMTKGRRKQLISEAVIDNGLPWSRQHLRSLETWYRSAPFFSRYQPFLKELYLRQWNKLKDLNTYIISYILQELSINKPMYFESELGITKDRTDRIIQICKKLNADTYLSGIGGRSYLEEGKFEEADIRLLYQDFKHPVYRQNYNDGFIPYLSVLDLLFNEGLNSRHILHLG